MMDLSAEFHGETPPGRDDAWSINTVATRVVVQGDVEECAVTATRLDPGDQHLLVTLRRPQKRTADVEAVVCRDETALRRWM